MTVCHCSLPVAKAFCFLEDLRWEFTTCFNSTAVSLADRPYPFLEFGEYEEKSVDRIKGFGESQTKLC